MRRAWVRCGVTAVGQVRGRWPRLLGVRRGRGHGLRRACAGGSCLTPTPCATGQERPAKCRESGLPWPRGVARGKGRCRAGRASLRTLRGAGGMATGGGFGGLRGGAGGGRGRRRAHRELRRSPAVRPAAWGAARAWGRGVRREAGPRAVWVARVAAAHRGAAAGRCWRRTGSSGRRAGCGRGRRSYPARWVLPAHAALAMAMPARRRVQQLLSCTGAANPLGVQAELSKPSEEIYLLACARLGVCRRTSASVKAPRALVSNIRPRAGTMPGGAGGGAARRGRLPRRLLGCRAGVVQARRPRARRAHPQRRRWGGPRGADMSAGGARRRAWRRGSGART